MNYPFDILPNGLRIVTVPMPERNSSAVAIWVRTGARFESQKNSGVSHFLEHMLFKGTKKRNTRQIKEDIEGVGGMLNAFTGEEVTCYFAKLLKQHFSTALDVLSDMVNHATLDAVEIKKERTVILEEIKMYRDLPAHHVQDIMSEMLWPDQPLGRHAARREIRLQLRDRALLDRVALVDVQRVEQLVGVGARAQQQKKRDRGQAERSRLRQQPSSLATLRLRDEKRFGFPVR